MSKNKNINIETLCVIRPSLEEERGNYVVVAEELPLSMGFATKEDAYDFCKIIFGASAFAQNSDGTVHVTRFDLQRKYRVPNHWSIDDAIKKINEGGLS